MRKKRRTSDTRITDCEQRTKQERNLEIESIKNEGKKLRIEEKKMGIVYQEFL